MSNLNARELNLDMLLDTLYAIQTSLMILCEHLARDRNPDVADAALVDLAAVHRLLQAHYPSLSRH